MFWYNTKTTVLSVLVQHGNDSPASEHQNDSQGAVIKNSHYSPHLGFVLIVVAAASFLLLFLLLLLCGVCFYLLLLLLFNVKTHSHFDLHSEFLFMSTEGKTL